MRNLSNDLGNKSNTRRVQFAIFPYVVEIPGRDCLDEGPASDEDENGNEIMADFENHNYLTSRRYHSCVQRFGLFVKEQCAFFLGSGISSVLSTGLAHLVNGHWAFILS